MSDLKCETAYIRSTAVGASEIKGIMKCSSEYHSRYNMFLDHIKRIISTNMYYGNERFSWGRIQDTMKLTPCQQCNDVNIRATQAIIILLIKLEAIEQ